MEAPASDDSKYSKYIVAAISDFLKFNEHRSYDAEIRAELRNPSNARLMNPKSNEDYFDLAMLVIDKHERINVPPDYREKGCRQLVLENYMGEGVAEEVKDDFKKMIDICLKHGRFRTIRLLGVLLYRFPIFTDFEEDFRTILHV